MPPDTKKFHNAPGPDREGTDDLLTGCLLYLSDGITSFAVKVNGQHGNIVDGLIAGLQRYCEEMIACGKIRWPSTESF